jgi:RimJ/RimL family protein N-acetyltransferase
MVIVTTERLILGHWQNSDREPFSRMNADSRVMEFMPSSLSPDESDTLIDHIEPHFRERGFGLCAAELRQDHSFVGFIGLAVPRFQAIFTVRRNWMATFGRILGPRAGNRRCAGNRAVRVWKSGT